MTAQEIFNEVWAKMAAQARPSKNGTTCLYRGPEGTACAVGCLLTDEEAEGLDDSPEGVSVQAVYDAGRLPARLAPHIGLLGKLQKAHDASIPEDAVWLEVFQSHATGIAAIFNLEVPE